MSTPFIKIVYTGKKEIDVFLEKRKEPLIFQGF